MRHLGLEVVAERSNRLLALVRFISDVFLQRTRAVLYQLSELFINGLLDGDLLGDHICHSRLQPIQLVRLCFNHLLVLLFLRLYLACDSVQQLTNRVKFLLSLTLLLIEPISQIRHHCISHGRLVSLCVLHVCLQAVQSVLQPFDPLLVLLAPAIRCHITKVKY